MHSLSTDSRAIAPGEQLKNDKQDGGFENQRADLFTGKFSPPREL